MLPILGVLFTLTYPKSAMVLESFVLFWVFSLDQHYWFTLPSQALRKTCELGVGIGLLVRFGLELGRGQWLGWLVRGSKHRIR